MKSLARVLFVALYGIVICSDVKALEISGNTIVSGNYVVNENITVLNGVLFEAHDIQTTYSLSIVNYGHISGGMDICANCMVEIRNIGIFDATVSRQSGAQFVQVITANEDITDIGLASGFNVVVRDGTDLDFNAVMMAATHADSIEIINSDFNVGAIGGFVAQSGVKLDGDIILRFDDVINQPVLLFSNVSGDGVVHVDSSALDSLHVFQTYRDDNNVFMRLARSVDYARILNNDMGYYLNELRASGGDNKLFSKLDVAESMGEINSILLDSVRTNPIRLMRPISLMNSYKMLEIMHIDDDMMFGVTPIMIYSSNVFMNGISPNVSFNLSDGLHLKLSGYVMGIDYADDINEYTGWTFGGDVYAQYDLSDSNFVRAHIGGGKSYFDIGPVFASNGIINNPDGTSVFTIGEYGHNFDIGGGYKLSPFVGIGAEYMAIANMNDTNLYGIGGTDIGYEYNFDGLRYDYIARAVARTDGTFGGEINFSVWSILDEAGADVHIGTIYNDDFGLSLSLSLNGRFRF